MGSRKCVASMQLSMTSRMNRNWGPVDIIYKGIFVLPPFLRGFPTEIPGRRPFVGRYLPNQFQARWEGGIAENM